MQKAIVAVTLAGTIGLAGVVVPRIARSDADDDDGRANGWCWGDGYGGHGPGMMGDAGMMGYGHGMMGQGYGGGMWSGASRGWGPGMMSGFPGLGPIWRLKLSDAQRTQVDEIAADLRRSNWTTIDKMDDARAKLRDLQSAPEPDPRKVGAAFAQLSKLQQDLVEATLQARNKARAVLTSAQREELNGWRTQNWRTSERGTATGTR